MKITNIPPTAQVIPNESIKNSSLAARALATSPTPGGPSRSQDRESPQKGGFAGCWSFATGSIPNTIRNCWQKASESMNDFSEKISQSMKTPDISGDSAKKLPFLRIEIEELSARIENIEQFVLERPELRKLCKKRWREFAQYMIKQPPARLQNLDMSDPINQKYVLARELHNKEIILDNYKTFVEYNPDVEELLRRYLTERDNQDKTARTETPYIIKQPIDRLQNLDMSNPINQKYVLRRELHNKEITLGNYKRFVQYNPNVEELLRRYLAERDNQEKTARTETPYIIKQPARLQNLDMSNPINQKYVLRRNLRNKEIILRNYQRFVQYNPNVEELLRRYLAERDNPEKTARTETP